LNPGGAMQTKLEFRHKFNGTIYDIDTQPFVAICESPNPDRKPAIRFPKGLSKTRECLITVVHEALHASDFNIPEEKVGRMSTEIGTLLWKLGYRR
jgi:hypothetical protein